MNKNPNSLFLNRRRFVLMALLLSVTMSAMAQVELVADLKPGGEAPESRFFNHHQSDGTRAFFVADGVELWTSDGTTAGTKALKRFVQIREIAVVGGTAIFSAQTNEAGYELWRSNGTAGGTVMLKDIFPGRGNSNPQELTILNGEVYFSANNNANGRELWKTNGTPEGTVLVKDVKPGNAGGLPADFAAVGNKIFFKAVTDEAGYELWASDGTASGTYMVKDIYPGEISAVPSKIVDVNGVAYFVASAPGATNQLWRSDGTSAGTLIVKEILGGADAGIFYLVNVEGILFFNATDATYGNELWRSDGTASGTYMIKDLTPGGSSTFNGWFEHLASINGKLYFTLQSAWPWYNIAMSDGTPEGTKLVTNYPENEEVQVDYNPSLSEINGMAYFLASSTDGKTHLYKADMNGVVSKVEDSVSPFKNNQIQVRKIGSLYHFAIDDSYWRSDGTSTGTWRLRSMGFPAGSTPMRLTDVNGTLYFHTQGTAELWRTNGTEETTVKIGNASTVHATGTGGDLFFVSGPINGAPSNSLWRSDGNPAGTFQLGTFDGDAARNFKWFKDRMYFSAPTASHGAELWMSDGTVAGTQMVQDVNAGASGAHPASLTPVGSTLYFTASTETSGTELWKTNGEPGGASLVSDILPGASSSYPEQLTSFKDKLYFFAYSSPAGREVWTSEGTAGTTSMLIDIRGGDSDTHEPQRDLGLMLATQDWLYFSAINADNKMSLWKSNGTAAGTTQLATFTNALYLPRLVAATNDEIFFFVERADFYFSFELWKASESGVVRVATFPGQKFDTNEGVTLKDDVLYFTTKDPTWEANSVYRSDGTAAGTYQIQFMGQPYRVAASGPHVYLTGQTQKEGEELFVIQVPASSATLANATVVTPLEESEILSTYPNPFGNSVHVRVTGKADETFNIRVVNVTGQEVESSDLSCNADHLVGTGWKNGIYIVQVRKGHKLITRRVVKSE